MYYFSKYDSILFLSWWHCRLHANHVFKTYFELKLQEKCLAYGTVFFSERYNTFICDFYWRSGMDTFSRIRSVIFCVTKFSYKNCLLESHLPIIMLVL